MWGDNQRINPSTIRVKKATKGKSSILVITFNRIVGDIELLEVVF